MDDTVKALEDAAFHAWVAIGEHLTKQRIPREDWRTIYERLDAALQAMNEARRTRGAAGPAAEATESSVP